jgi:hypothetical protein
MVVRAATRMLLGGYWRLTWDIEAVGLGTVLRRGRSRARRAETSPYGAMLCATRRPAFLESLIDPLVMRPRRRTARAPRVRQVAACLRVPVSAVARDAEERDRVRDPFQGALVDAFETK